MTTHHPITLTPETISQLEKTHRVRSAGRDEDHPGEWLFLLEERHRDPDGYYYKRRIRAKYTGEVNT